jgi:hypothetical protein
VGSESGHSYEALTVWTVIIGAAGSILAALLGLIGKKKDAEDGLARVQAGQDAAKAVDNSPKAVADDPNNLDR